MFQKILQVGSSSEIVINPQFVDQSILSNNGTHNVTFDSSKTYMVFAVLRTAYNADQTFRNIGYFIKNGEVSLIHGEDGGVSSVTISDNTIILKGLNGSYATEFAVYQLTE